MIRLGGPAKLPLVLEECEGALWERQTEDGILRGSEPNNRGSVAETREEVVDEQTLLVAELNSTSFASFHVFLI